MKSWSPPAPTLILQPGGRQLRRPHERAQRHYPQPRTASISRDRRYDLVSNDYQQQGASEGKRTAATIGGGAAVGAIIGGLIGGGKGAAIGAGAGAGAGTAGAAATKAQQVKVPAETKLDFTLQQPVSVTYSPEKNNSTR